MSDLRRDYFLDKFVIVPKSEQELLGETKNAEICPFCPGNESMTEPSILSLVVKDGILKRLSDTEDNIIDDWCVRVFHSSKPAVTTNSTNEYSERPLYSEPAYGYHLIIVPTPNHRESLSKLPLDQWSNILLVLQDRVRWLYSQKSVTYVSIFINKGNNAGGDNKHPYLNIITFSSIPPIIELEAEASHDYINEHGNCPACNMLSIEISGPRQILDTDSFTAISPWAPSYPFEFWIYPKRHSTSFSKITQKEIDDLALILRSTLGGMDNALNSPDYNLVFHLSPEKKNSRQIHWHVEIYPQINPLGGLEKGFGVYISSTKPEKYAEILGSACRKELACLVGIT